jgi:hypothetical protein
MRVCGLLLFAMLLWASFAVVGYCSSETDARSAVAEASQRVNTCYSAVADAAKAGANVSGMLVTLDGAGGLLSKAEVALVKGEFDSASTLAHLCEERLVGFEDVAVGLRDVASGSRTLDFAFGVVGSSVGAVLVVVLGFLLWPFLKKRYGSKVV